MKTASAFVLSIALLLPPFITFAQEGEPMPFIPQPGDPTDEAMVELPSCFDYYRFGSTPIILGSEMTSVAQGSEMVVTGTITNENAYPLSDVAVHIKVLHRENPGVKSSFGPDVVDWFTVEDNLTLRAGEVRPLSFVWKVPKDAEPGDYQVASFVASHDRFNMLGLSFATDVIGGSHKFKVVGDERGATRFDVTKSTIGGFEHHAAAFSPRMEYSEEGLPLSATLSNTSAAPFTGEVLWKLYAWDSLNEVNLLETKKETVALTQGESVTLPYLVDDNAHSVYYLVGELVPSEEGASKSFISIRFVIDSVTEPRLNFVGVSGYPTGEDTAVFACAHSTGMAPAENVRVEVAAYSDNLFERLIDGGAFAKSSYEGTMPGAISAVVAKTAKERSSFKVEAKLYQDGKLLDEVTVPYSCKELGVPCEKDWLMLLIAALVIVLLIFGARKLLHPKKIVTPASTPNV